MKTNIIIFKKQLIKILALGLVNLFIPMQIEAQTITTIQVHNLTTPNPVEKMGYNLIWIDEFPGTSVASDWRNFTTPAPQEGCWWRTENEALDTITEYSSNLIINCTPSITYTNSKLNIVLGNNSCQDKNYSLFIYNLQGQRINFVQINANIEIEIPSGPSGVYIAILITQSGEIVSTNKFYR